MDWLMIALENPLDNWTVWLVIAIGILSVLELVIKAFSDFLGSSNRLMRDMQRNTETDNSLQGRLIDEMTARRISDDKHKTRLADLVDEKLVRIDGTTQDTNHKAGTMLKEMRRTQLAFKLLYEELRTKGILK